MDDKCPKCGSVRIIKRKKGQPVAYSPCVRVSGRASGPFVVVHGEPSALVFSDSVEEMIVADVCGDCGFLELFATDPANLLAASIRASTRK